ncbi:homeobox protein CHOX-CAD-like [Neosynchiropus ocellatus]
MYPHTQTLAFNSQYMPPSYDFNSYHHVPGVSDPSGSTWNPFYGAREDYLSSFPPVSTSPGQSGFLSSEHCNIATAGGGSFTPYLPHAGQEPPSTKKRPPETITSPVSVGKTRTEGKYRVVYTDLQRLELEKEFRSNSYITMRRKAELSGALNLSERQVKIWFQNRRAKERKINRKKQQLSQQASTTTPTVEGKLSDRHTTTSSDNVLADDMSHDYKLEYT